MDKQVVLISTGDLTQEDRDMCEVMEIFINHALKNKIFNALLGEHVDQIQAKWKSIINLE